MRYLSESVDDFDLVYGVYAWTQPAVYAEDIVVDDDREGEVVKHVGEIVPDICVAVFSRTLGVEAVGLGYAARFVVSADEVNAMWVAKLEADEEGYCFDTEETAVYIVAWLGRLEGLAQ